MPHKEKIYSLDSLGLIDAPSHADLDILTDLARNALGAENALVTIVRPTYDRQYIISHSGVSAIPQKYRRLPLRYSICKHVREANAPVTFPDAAQAPVLAGNPVISEYAVGSYVGVPIHRTDGGAIGALCCIEHQPRSWTAPEIRTLSQFATCVDSYIRLLRLNVEQRRANGELEKIAAARASFLSHMSHELRTPMTGVVGASKLLMSLGLDGQAGNLAKLLDRSSTRLLEMVNDVLDLAKIDAGHVEADEAPCDLEALIADVIAPHEQAARQKGVEMTLNYAIPQKWLMADRQLLGSVLQNLVGNAVKFTDAGRITMTVESFEQGAVSIKVSDTGIGIAPGRQKAIFDEFEQASPDISGTYGGTGLGLAIVKRRIELMRGDIEVKSALGKGTTFRILLPMTAAPSPTNGCLAS